MRVAAIQCDVSFADFDANLKSIVQSIATAADSGVQLAVFPECVLSGYAFDDRESALRAAVTLEDPCWESIIQAAAGSIHVTIGCLLSQRDDPGDAAERLFNATVLVGPGGIVSHYRKVHLPYLGVDRFVDRGDRSDAVAQVGDAKVGMAICYDGSFPEPMRVLGLLNADIVALGTNWPVAAFRTAEVVPPARSMENHYYFIAANRIGSENGFDFCGKSSICGPDGVVLASVDHAQPAMLVADVDLAAARNKRIERTAGAHVIDRMADRRPELYGEIVRPRGET